MHVIFNQIEYVDRWNRLLSILKEAPKATEEQYEAVQFVADADLEEVEVQTYGALTMAAFMEITVKQSGAVNLNRHLVSSMGQAVEGMEIKEEKSGKILFQRGKSKARMVPLEKQVVTRVEALPELASVSLEDLGQLLESVAFIPKEDPVALKTMTVLQIQEGGTKVCAYASDGHRLAYRALEMISPFDEGEKLCLHVNTLKQLIKFCKTSGGEGKWGRAHRRLVLTDQEIVLFVPLMDSTLAFHLEQFTDMIDGEGFKHNVLVDRKKVIHALKVCTASGRYRDKEDRQGDPVMGGLEEGQLRLWVDGSRFSATEYIDVVEGEHTFHERERREARFQIASKNLRQALEEIDTDFVNLSWNSQDAPDARLTALHVEAHPMRETAHLVMQSRFLGAGAEEKA